ncbi:MAG: N-acetyltransferase [Deltaproteobacteria bacterium]|nr:N-acetyltransferase [Deltaproteobacteria bacterium]
MISIEEVRNKKDLKKFVDFPYELYRNYPAWVPPIRKERLEFLSEKNPFFRHGKAQYFLALDNGEVVGRISAHLNYLHNERYRDKTGFFGFFESSDDGRVAASLFDAASAWLKREGMEVARGPFNFSINDDCGILLEGFDTPPFILMTHNPWYYQGLFDKCGFYKAKDLYAWKYDSRRPVPEMALAIAESVKSHNGLVIREVNMRELERDLRILLDIFNEAWANNWGFIPLTEEEVAHSAKELKMILNPKLALIAEVDGEPAAISLAMPNIHESIRDLNGRLFPFGIFKLLFRMKFAPPKSARLIMLGVRRKFRSSTLGGLSVLLYSEMHKRSRELGHWGGELSWTLEDNDKINRGIELMGGVVYKRYRIYERNI